MHEPSHDPPPLTAALAAVPAGLASAAGFLHSCLWPPCFQWTFWHAAEQYITPLHPPQRCNPSLVHPPLAHLGASRATSSTPALPDIVWSPRGVAALHKLQTFRPVTQHMVREVSSAQFHQQSERRQTGCTATMAEVGSHPLSSPSGPLLTTWLRIATATRAERRQELGHCGD
jgi:hypothetical protein